MARKVFRDAVTLKEQTLTELFYQLINNALDEVLLREPNYFSRFAIGVPPLDHPKYSSHEIRQGLGEGMAHMEGLGIRFNHVAEALDPVGELLVDSIVDAVAADQGALPLLPHPREPRSLSDLLSKDYQERTADGRRYFIRLREGRAILLISATGIPMALWSRFLGDPLHDFRIMMIEGRCGDLLMGGMENASELSRDAENIVNVLEKESVTEAGVIGWCNGARLAIEVASLCPHRVQSVVLVGPALSGIQGVPPSPSRFEAAMKKVFSALAERPALARTYVKALEDKAPDWDNLADSKSRAAALFALPPLSHALALRRPISQADFLLNYGRRLSSDAAYPVGQAWAKLDQETMLVTGSYDNLVNNEFIWTVLNAYRSSGIHVNVKGGGHYLHDLQYQYFRFITEIFLAKRRLPTGTARLDVKIINGLSATEGFRQ